MSGWEKYVEQAAVSLDPAAFDRTIENHGGYIRQFRRDRATELARGVLAAVGPLIAEDARERMVAAAGKALEREDRAKGTPCPDCRAFPGRDHSPSCLFEVIREIHAAVPVLQPSQFTVWCNECSTTWPCATAEILENAS